jgi:hypothetical protein
MLILGLLGMYFDAAVVFIKKSSLLFRLAVAILCLLRRLKKDNKYLDNEKKQTAELISNQLGVPLSKSNFLLLI